MGRRGRWGWLCLAVSLGTAGLAIAKDDPQCKVDADCVFDDVDCSPCGHCPGFPPVAESRRERDARARACELYEKQQAAPRAPDAGPPLALPNCSPCPAPPPGPLPTRAACERGRCVAR
ncbi:MAG TPA: hypothetical protein VMB50_08805 [Myxococcales bacterium]|nr:hypothetical protein [Myxococcales bacterium]